MKYYRTQKYVIQNSERNGSNGEDSKGKKEKKKTYELLFQETSNIVEEII